MKHFKLALLLTIMSLIGFLLAIPYTTALLEPQIAKLQAPLSTVLIASIVQNCITAFVTAWLGCMLAERTGLGAPILRRWLYKEEGPSFTKQNVGLALLLGLVSSGLVIGAELLLFQPNLPEMQDTMPQVSWYAGVLTFVQGGVYEEILLRLFLMSLLVWLLQKVFGKGQAQPWMYWTAIVLAAVIFGVSHLPATVQIFGDMTALLFIRALVLNGIMGIVCGYLYWKKGLEYAMIAHGIGDIVLHGLFS